MLRPNVTNTDAKNHIRAIEISKGISIRDPRKYFQKKILEITQRLHRERRLDPQSHEMTESRSFMSLEEHFQWLSGVLAYQQAYLATFA